MMRIALYRHVSHLLHDVSRVYETIEACLRHVVYVQMSR